MISASRCTLFMNNKYRCSSISFLEIVNREREISMLIFLSGLSDPVLYKLILLFNFDVDIRLSKLRLLIILMKIVLLLFHYVT
jgi:hypothetical protein